MRIILIGQAAFGEKILQGLLEKREQVVAVYVPPSIPGKSPDPLKESAEKEGIPVFQPASMRAPDVYAKCAELNPDIGIMAFVTIIIPEQIIRCPRLGTIQYHPSLLPKHRGGSAINWAVINGETKTGLTIFWPDRGVDTGPILLQKEVDISPDDTVGSLYFNKLFPLGVQALMEAVDLVKQGIAPRIPQDESQASYEGLCTEKNAIIDWSQPVTKVYNLIRGTNPQPGAITYFRGRRLKIFDSEQVRVSPQRTPGQVVECNDKGFVVASQGGSILVKRVQPEDLGKIPATQYIQAAGLKPGDCFG